MVIGIMPMMPLMFLPVSTLHMKLFGPEYGRVFAFSSMKNRMMAASKVSEFGPCEICGLSALVPRV